MRTLTEVPRPQEALQGVQGAQPDTRQSTLAPEFVDGLEASV